MLTLKNDYIFAMEFGEWGRGWTRERRAVKKDPEGEYLARL